MLNHGCLCMHLCRLQGRWSVAGWGLREGIYE